MTFDAKARSHSFVMDVADLGGKNLGPTPKEMMISAVLGCTGMDVVALLKKFRLPIKSLRLSGEGTPRATHPKILSQLDLVYEFEVDFQDPEKELPKVLEAVTLSMTRYCGVSATIAAATPIFYTVIINGQIEARDQANFSESR